MLDAPALLRNTRLACGLSQRETARLAATSASAVSRYEQGLTSPTVGTLNRLLSACYQRGKRRWPTLADLAPALAERIEHDTSANAWRLVGEVVDDEKSRSREETAACISVRPDLTSNTQADATVAALAEWLALQRSIPAPPWSQEGYREARPWWFVSGHRSFYAQALRDSPISFSRRGVFITRQALERV